MSKAHPRTFLRDPPQPEEVRQIRILWIVGLDTLSIALRLYRGDRSMEPRVAAILARLQDERHAARTRLSPPRSTP